MKQKEGADYVITGNGKFVKDGDKKSWGQEDRDAVYLDYTLTLGNTIRMLLKIRWWYLPGVSWKKHLSQ